MQAKREKTFYLDVTPISWKRAGHNATTNTFYDTQKSDKVRCSLLLLNQHNDDPLYGPEPVELSAVFYLPIPPGKKNKKYSPYHATPPDIDNYLKFLLDMINGVLITDDRCISVLSAQKIYDDQPRTIFTLRSLSHE